MWFARNAGFAASWTAARAVQCVRGAMADISSVPSLTEEAAESAPPVPDHTAPVESLTGHNYDGIEEYDNPMPGWWVTVFWTSFYFAICYVLWFHVFMKGSIAEEYATDLRISREEAAKRELGTEVNEESLEKLVKNGAILADARALFSKRCVQCHGQNGEGLIGPNLTDDYWLHGAGTLTDIHRTITQGVPSKGMPEWGKQLAPIEIAKLAAYVGSIRGKHLPGKPPEGTLATPAPQAGK
jgi:cytochrome c oxidase cbb3-type subunit 3